jgi:RNA polymerase primary sigma factor
VFEDEDTPMMALFQTDEAGSAEMEEEALMVTLRESLSVLSERELLIVQAYFGLNGTEAKTLEQIGQELGVTRERVRQLRNRALARVREHYGDLLMELSAN